MFVIHHAFGAFAVVQTVFARLLMFALEVFAPFLDVLDFLENLENLENLEILEAEVQCREVPLLQYIVCQVAAAAVASARWPAFELQAFVPFAVAQAVFARRLLMFALDAFAPFLEVLDFLGILVADLQCNEVPLPQYMAYWQTVAQTMSVQLQCPALQDVALFLDVLVFLEILLVAALCRKVPLLQYIACRQAVVQMVSAWRQAFAQQMFVLFAGEQAVFARRQAFAPFGEVQTASAA